MSSNKQIPPDTALPNPAHTFDTLVCGRANREICETARRIARSPGGGIYNPLFLYGAAGTGKTHLAEAVGNEFLRLHPAGRVYCLNTDDYTQSLIKAIRTNKYADGDFGRQYQDADLLIADDIQLLQGRERTAEEFLRLFEHYRARGCQIVVCGSCPPQALADTNPGLASRLSHGIVIRLDAPDAAMRAAIVQAKAAAAGVELSEAAAERLAAYPAGADVRCLTGLLNRLIAVCQTENRVRIEADWPEEMLCGR
ncbi:DnaA ATPase domain-containing protein [Kingella potus]|nr:DnaA/Hda family protein [Kingella potus]